MAQLMTMSATNSFDSVRNTVPPELNEVRHRLQSCIEEARNAIASEFKQEGTLPVVIGGFSQGAMLATDTELRSSLTGIAGLIAYSGALICESLWRKSTNPVRGLPLVQSHGRLDNILPFATGQWLYETLSDLGLDGKLLEFDGPHTIPSEAILQTAKLLHTIGK
jgi:phospholipase/carboxylesterase